MIGNSQHKSSTLPPFDTVSTLVIRTAECSGKFCLQAYQRDAILERKSYYNIEIEEIKDSLIRINRLLSTTKGI